MFTIAGFSRAAAHMSEVLFILLKEIFTLYLFQIVECL